MSKTTSQFRTILQNITCGRYFDRQEATNAVAKAKADHTIDDVDYRLLVAALEAL